MNVFIVAKYSCTELESILYVSMEAQSPPGATSVHRKFLNFKRRKKKRGGGKQ